MSAPDLDLRARARLGTTLRGKYRLVSVLGVGGMAVVYRAVHRNQAEFAVKMLLPELSVQDEIKKRFLREGYAANTVKHPGVVAIVDDDVAEDGAAFLVMELLEGMSVEDLARRYGGRLPARIAAGIGCQLLDVLASAHARGILHRDIKPANLFATKTGLVKVLDFGIARVRDVASGGAYATQSSAAFGTPAFMAPEQARGKTREMDERSDVWAVGATLYTSITGGIVHEGENGVEIVVKAATQPAASITVRAPETPAAIAAVIDRALAFDPANRWSSAGEMRDALLRAFGESFGAQPSQAELAAFLATAPQPPAPAFGDEPTREVGATAPNAPLPAPPPPAPGKTTAVPVSRDESRRARPRRRVLVAALSGSTVLVLGIVGIVALARMRATEAAGPAITHEAPPSASAAAPLPPPTATIAPGPSAGPILSVTDLPVSTEKPAALASPPPPTEAPHRPAVKVRAAPSASTKPNCNPNYVLDAEGNKHFKPECF